MKRLSLLGFLLLLAAALLGPAWGPAAAGATDDYEEVKGEDVPYLPPYPGSKRIEAEKKDYGSYKFAVKFDEYDDRKEQAAEGKFYHLKYLLVADKSQLEILRNYENAFKAKGWQVVVAAEPDRIYLGTVTAHQTTPQDIWAEVHCDPPETDDNDVQFIQYDITVIEGKKMEQAIEIKDASALSKELNASGRVAVYGINFDTGKATIKPDSEKALKEVGKLLEDNPGLKLSIEGHTDNVGDKQANQKLSEDRAASVKDYLVKNYKIAADRLATKGFGDTKPVADNKTDEGRAKNRRVELVKM
jgi:outer membrane protein OmpA-like peptidoglycan-associated protein